jgi:hypothetical protein
MKHLPRDNQRAYITFYLRVFEGDKFLGFLIDLAQGGVKILSDFIMEKDKLYMLKMKLPSTLVWDGKMDADRSITITANCLWSKHDDVKKDFYISGFQFTGLLEEDNKIIHSLIEQYKIP